MLLKFKGCQTVAQRAQPCTVQRKSSRNSIHLEKPLHPAGLAHRFREDTLRCVPPRPQAHQAMTVPRGLKIFFEQTKLSPAIAWFIEHGHVP